MSYINPDRLSSSQIQRIDRWLVANGCTDHVALEPVTIRGTRVEYSALSKRNHKAIMRAKVIDSGTEMARIRSTRKSLHIRIPLSAVA